MIVIHMKKSVRVWISMARLVCRSAVLNEDMGSPEEADNRPGMRFAAFGPAGRR
jgi:hypothetical protein